MRHIVILTRLWMVSLVCGLVLSGCATQFSSLYKPLAPAVPAPCAKTLSLADLVDERPWYQRMALPSNGAPFWSSRSWCPEDLEGELSPVLLEELRRSNAFESVCYPQVEGGYLLKVTIRSVMVRDEMKWWSDPVPLYLVGALVGIPMRTVRAEAIFRCRLYQEGSLILDEEIRGETGPRLAEEAFLGRARTKAACRAVASGIARMVCSIERTLCPNIVSEEQK